jgi:hypothetical protein
LNDVDGIFDGGRGETKGLSFKMTELGVVREFEL